MPNVEVTLPALHDGQAIVDSSPARFKVVVCGRRWGKTEYAAQTALEQAALGKFVWWVAPTYPMASVGWDILKHYAAQIPYVTKREMDRMITFPNGGWVQAKSADKPDSLRGRGLDLVVLDEAAFIPNSQAWQQALRPSLSSPGRDGKAIFISTPKGRNWFYHLYQTALSDPDWDYWQFPTSANPYIDPDEIIEARQHLPEAVFKQEYLAEFIEDAGLVFRNVRNCTSDVIHEHQAGGRYVAGVDWAQSNDFTVIYIMDADTFEIVAYDRFNQIDWHTQRQRLKVLADIWQPDMILAESNSIGQPNIEALQRDGLPVTGFTTTNQSKQDVISALQLAFEQQTITIPDDPVLIGELESFEASRLPSGKWRYEAPGGMHDDTVIALALTLEAANMGHLWRVDYA